MQQQQPQTQQQQQQHQQPLEMSLREHLLAASASGSASSPYTPTSAAHHQHPYPPPPDGSPHDRSLDPTVTGQPLQYGMGGDSGADDGMSPDSRKGKRELSTSKRAAQNRAAQRAFRQRKEGYIKKLEEQVREFMNMEQNYKTLQNENYQLREYILNLQSRLLESQADFPPAPSHINLSSNAAPSAANLAESAYDAEQQLRREMEQRQQPPPPAPVVAREDPIPRDGISQLQQAAAAHDVRPQHSSPYGLGSDYHNQHPPRQQGREDEAHAAGNDSKTTV